MLRTLYGMARFVDENSYADKPNDKSSQSVQHDRNRLQHRRRNLPILHDKLDGDA